jgi:predicted transposase YdaD
MMLVYFYQTQKGTNSASTVKKIANRIKHPKVRNEVMSLAEALHKEGRQEGLHEGRQEGRQEGVLIGKIQLCQRLLRRREQTAEELAAFSSAELQRELAALQSKVEGNFRAE